MRPTAVLALGFLVAVFPVGCAPAPTLTPLPAAAAHRELTAARTAFSHAPTDPDRRLAYGRALYFVNDYLGVRRTLEPLLALGGTTGAQANLFVGAAAQRDGELSEARVEYLRYLSIVKKDADVEARLGDIARQEAVLAAQAAVRDEKALNPSTYSAAAVGVSPLTVAAGDSTLIPLGYGLADLLIADLAVSPKLQIVDRVRVDAVLRELDLVSKGRTDAPSAPQLGKLVGASRLVSGVITPQQRSHLTVDARVTSVEVGTPVGRPVIEETALVEILDAEKELAIRLFAELGVALTPAERAAVERRPTRYLSAFLAYARGSNAESHWNLDAAEAYYAAALSIDPGFELARRRLSSVRANSGRPSLNQPPLEPENWIQSILGGVTQGINPSPGDVVGAAGNTTNDPLGAALSAVSAGTIVIIIGTP